MRTMLGFAGALALVAACGGRASLSSDDPQAGSAGAATATGGGGLASDGAAGTAPGSPDAAGIPPMDGSMGGGPSVRKRLIFFYTPHGTVLDAWRPAADADHRLTNMGTILQSLEPFRSKITVVEGLGNWSSKGVPATTHEFAASVVLTAHLGPRGDDGTYFRAGGPSLDHVAGRATVSDVVFSSLAFGVHALANSAMVSVNYDVDGTAVPLMNDPKEASLRVFSSQGPPGDFTTEAAIPIAGQLQMQYLAKALSHDVTRSASIRWCDVQGDVHFPWLGIADAYHDLAHASGGAKRAQFIAIQKWFAEQFRFLLGQLDAIPEGSGTVLDHSAVVWISETGEASSDSGASIPVVIAGSLAGYLRTGFDWRYDGRSQADLLLTLARGMGVDKFGDPALEPGPLTELLQ